MAKVSTWKKWLKDFLAEQGDPDPASTDINNIPSDEEGETLIGTEGADRLEAGEGGDTLKGMGGADYLAGNMGADYLFGGNGRDTLHGNLGHDYLYGGRGKDTLYGDPGHDVLFGGNGRDTLHGGAGNDVLYGGRGDDTLDGGHDNDVLRGGRGKDTLTGGFGADRFEFHRKSGHDVITDFLESGGGVRVYPDPENEGKMIQVPTGPGNTDDQGNYHADWRDKLVFYGKNLDYEDLMIEDTDSGVMITGYGKDASVTLTGISADDLSESDFVFMG